MIGLGLPMLVWDAWAALGSPLTVLSVEELSILVSTNSVYRLRLSDHSSVIAKVSSYGSYVHFRQDHRLIHQWIGLLQGSRYERLLAPILCKDGRAFTHRAPSGQERDPLELHGNSECWVAFYQEIDAQGLLPPLLTEAQIDSLGEELAHFHAASAKVAPELGPSWKSLGSDIANLYDALGNVAWRSQRHLSDWDEAPLKAQCDRFLEEAERLGYPSLQRIPVLVDWNSGNFAVDELPTEGFRLRARWDYDWFRLEPRGLDFYFCSRVVRPSGDQAHFSYDIRPLLEPRFRRFLRAYHTVYPLSENEILLLKEYYRFFLLNYVVRSGEHFFSRRLWPRLVAEAVKRELPSVDEINFEDLFDVLR